MTLCKNGLHELPDDGWRAPNGARCRECYRATQGRYEATRIQVNIGGGLLRLSYRVPAERKEELVQRLADFRVGQTEEYRQEMMG